MNIPSDIRTVSFSSYFTFSRILDYIWGSCAGRGASKDNAIKYIPTLVRWRSTINKMRIYSSAKMSLPEHINYNRASKDLDSLLFRLHKLVGMAQVKVSDDTESESADQPDD